VTSFTIWSYNIQGTCLDGYVVHQRLESSFSYTGRNKLFWEVSMFAKKSISCAISVSLVIALILVFVDSVLAANISVDDFNPGADGWVGALVVQPDGKILVGGDFNHLGGAARNYIGRLNVDGSLDTNFNPGADDMVTSLAIQPDGKILVGGWFTMLGGSTRNYIGRLNADGTLDTSFDPGANGSIHTFVLQPDGKILVGGGFTTLGGGARSKIGRLNADGSLDTSFNPGASMDNINQAVVYTIAVQLDGKILVGGEFTTLGEGARTRIGRLNANGSLDTSFNTTTYFSTVTGLIVQPDGKALVAGGSIKRLNLDGSLDSSFSPGTDNVIADSIDLQLDGKIIMGGMTPTFVGNEITHYIKWLNADGTLDTSFNPGSDSYISPLVIQPDGKLLVGGDFAVLGESSRNNIGRLSNDASSVTQNLTSNYDGTTLTWQRSGTGPEVSYVTFELSTDEINYTNLGMGERINSGWQLTGLALPKEQNLFIRAQGYYNSGGSSGSVVQSVSSIYLEGAPSSILSIVRVGASPIDASSVDFTVNFSEPVMGVDINDFSLTTSGVPDASITTVSGSSDIYTVSVNTGSGEGMIRLDIPVTATITDLTGNPLIGLPFNNGETYTIEFTSPEMNVKGNSSSIADGDTSPSATDHTDFGSADISSGTVERTFTIENTGTTGLNLSGIPKINISGTNTSDFSLTSDPTSPVTINGLTTFTVVFDPTVIGARVATISIANNDSDESPYNFSIQGTGISLNLTVTKIGDTNDGICNTDCSLREAIAVAVNGSTISFDPSLSGQTIVLASTLSINKNITIDGTGLSSRIAVSGNDAWRILSTGTGNNVTIKNIILKNGKRTGTSYTEYGAAIFVNGGTSTLIVQNVTFSNNAAYAAGAIYISPSSNVTILDSEFTNNMAQNVGSAIYVKSGGNLTLKNSKLLNNTAVGDGTVYFSGATTSNLENNLFEGNSSSNGGAVSTQLGNATLVIKKNLFKQNSSSNVSGGGGALYLSYSVTPILFTIENNTFYGNTAASKGGAIYLSNGVAYLNNNTFSNNTANMAGGNGGGNLYSAGGSNTSQMYNNIIANSVAGHDCVMQGNVTGGNNLVMDGSTTCKPSITGDPNLSPLADNGGFTQTLGLPSGSNAIDAANDTYCPATDQRGITRPQGTHCDIGAYEFEDVTAPTFTPTITGTPVSTQVPDSTPTATMTNTPTPTRTATSSSTPTGAYTPTMTFTSSPTATDSATTTYLIYGNVGVEGAVLSYFDGSPKFVISDDDGDYSFPVSSHWFGKVVPSKIEHSFTPASIDYDEVVIDQFNQNYSTSYNTCEAYGNVGEADFISVLPNGVTGNHATYMPKISANGCYAAFYSDSSNLVDMDTNNTGDIFIRNMATSVINLVSVSSSGVQGSNANRSSDDNIAISADGRYVAFNTPTSNLVDGDINGYRDVFLHDTHTGTTILISKSSNGTQAMNGDSYYPSISADGRYIAFASRATNLFNGDTNERSDVFIHDTLTGITTLVSVSSSGVFGDNASNFPSISADGRYIAFESYSDNLIAEDTNLSPDIFVRDLQTSTTFLASANSSGIQADNGTKPAFSFKAAISANGRYVAFTSQASNLVSGDTNAQADTFLRDIIAGTTERVSVSSSETQASGVTESPCSISADGRYVVFSSQANNLVSGDTDGSVEDVFLRDRSTGVTRLIQFPSPFSRDPTISANGRYVMVLSIASSWDGFVYVNDITFPTTNGVDDIIVNQDAQNVNMDLWEIFADTENPGSALAYTITGNTNPSLFTSVTVPAPGEQYLVLDFEPDTMGTTTITVRATDPAGLFVETSFMVSVIKNIVISGNTEVDGVTLSYMDIVPKTVTSSLDGSYSITVPYNWNGTITASKSGYAFSPSSRIYTNVSADQTERDYAPLLVVNTNDDGPGSLRHIITHSNTGDTITFAPPLSGQTIHLASTLLIDKGLTIDGSSLASHIQISGDTDNDGIGDVSVFRIEGATPVELNGLDIVKGNSGIKNIGGGIFNLGNLTITNTNISGNSSWYGGGGVLNDSDGILTIVNSTISNNFAPNGSGILNLSPTGTVNISNSTISGNSIRDINGDGGGISNLGNLTITNTNISGNSSTFGGGISNFGTSTVINSTISGNSAITSGGGILNASIPNYANAILTIENSTISNNSAPSGGGMANSGSLNYLNTIIANSTSGGDCINDAQFGTINTNIHNLVEDGSCSASLSGDPKLGPLANNGGSTHTMALLSTSPAIGAGNDDTCEDTDQRGITRPQGAHCDIGAYEFVDASGPTPTPTVTKTLTSTQVPDSTPTATITSTPTPTNTPTPTDAYTPTMTFTSTPTATDIPTNTPVPPTVTTTSTPTVTPTVAPTHTSTSTVTKTPTNTPTPTSTATRTATATQTGSPSVVSISRANTNPTAATSVKFTVKFSEVVTGVDAADFSLTLTGVTSAKVTAVSGSGATRTVTVSTGNGNGTLRLNVIDNDTIRDAAGNKLGGAGLGNGNYTAGQSYTIDKTAPKVISSVRVNSSTTNLASVKFTVKFSEVVTGVDAADFSLTLTGIKGAKVTSVSGSGTTRTVTVSTGTGNGTLRLNVIDNDTIRDAAGNKLGGTGLRNGNYMTGQSYTIHKP
jgi:uncharacterized delta-60 repeat protein/CSLREA domain-containing protein